MALDTHALSQIIRPIVERSLSSLGLDRTEIRTRTDRDGDPIVEIAAHFPSRTRRIPSHVTFDLNQKLLAALRENRDDHFPILLMLYEEDGVPSGEVHPPRRRRAQ